MRVLALDLSLTSTGVAYPDGFVTRWTPPKGVVGTDRLRWFRETVGVAAASIDDPADLVVLEGYSFGTARQASHAHALGELGGVVRLALDDCKVPWVDVPPASLKKYATGRGNANKELVLVEAVKRLGYEGSSNDEADALWLRAMALDAYGEVPVVVPSLNRSALDAVPWPELDLAS